MRSTLAVTGLCLALAGLVLMAPSAAAQSLPRTGSITLYGFAGGLNQEQKDVNDIIRAQQELLRQDGVYADYDLLGIGWIVGGGGWWQATKRIGIGGEYAYQHQEVQNDVFVGEFGSESGIYNGAGGLIQDVSLTLTWFPPLDVGLFVGGGLGYGWCEMFEEVELVVSGAPDQNSTVRGAWTANGITSQAFLGYHFNFVWGSRILIRGGYRFMMMSDLEGTSRRTTVDPDTGGPVSEPTPTLPMGEVDWDFGGWNAVVLLGIPFFGSDEE